MRRLQFGLTAALLWAPLRTTPPDTYERQPAIDAHHYAYRLTLSDSSDEILGEAAVTMRFVLDGATSFWLDLASAASGKGMTVTDVTGAGGAVRWTHTANRVRITLAAAPAKGTLQTFTIRYRGVPASGLRIGPNKYQERTFFALNWPDKAREWIPIIDHPSDKATSEFTVVAPIKYRVVANGLLQQEREMGDGTRLTHWKQSVPISSWLNAIGVATFGTRHYGPIRGIQVSTWVARQDHENGIASFEEPTRRALEFFIDHIGPYPYEKLANVTAAGLGGGTEHASVIFYGENTASGRPATGLVAHEIAHQWFGDAVTERDWDDVWLSEGFATYFTLLATEHYDGRDAFVAGLQSSRQRVFTTEQRMPTQAVIHQNLSDMRLVLNQLAYQKGGWVLHMLRGQVGTDVFWRGIREYYRRYRDANASTDEFRAVMEEVSGQDLRWFVNQWLRRAGSPVVAGQWQYNAATKMVTVTLSQTQPGELYRLPMDIGVTPDSGQARTQRVEFTQREQRFDIPSDRAPTAVVLDPNTWVLMRATLERRP